VNVSGLLAVFERLAHYRALREELLNNDVPSPSGLLRAARSPLLAALARDLQRPLLVVVGTTERSRSLFHSLRDWSPAPELVLRFPEPPALFYEAIPWSEEVIAGRLQVIHSLYSAAGTGIVVVTSVRALMQRTLPRRQFRASVREFQVGQVLDPESIISRWAGLGYEPVNVVESPG